MIKYSLLFICLIATLTVNADKDESKELAMKAVGKCSIKYKPNIKELEQIMAEGVIPRTGTMKCFINCVMTEMGLIVDGKFNPERSYELNKMRFQSSSILEKADEATKYCYESLTIPDDNDDECLVGLEIASCALRFAKEHNIMELRI